MEVTVLGMNTSRKASQPKNICVWMVVSPSGNTTDSSVTQLRNTPEPTERLTSTATSSAPSSVPGFMIGSSPSPPPKMIVLTPLFISKAPSQMARTVEGMSTTPSAPLFLRGQKASALI